MSYIIIDLRTGQIFIRLYINPLTLLLSGVAEINLRQDNSRYKKMGQTCIVNIVRW